MGDSTEMIKSIINQLKPKSKPELYDVEYESIIEYLSSKEHLLNELMNDRGCLEDLPSVRSHNELPSLMDSKLVLREQVCVWSALEYDLTPNQKKLNEELLKTLKCLTSYYTSFDNAESLKKFLHDNKNDKDLKVILNLKRGASESTVLHAIAGAKNDEFRHPGDRAIDLLLDAGADPNIKNNAGKTPLHLAVATGYGCSVDSLLSKGANPSVADRKGKTPQQIAVNNHRYDIEVLFLTDKQKELMRELYDLDRFDSDYTKNLEKFLSKHEGDLDLKVVLNIRNAGGESELFSHLDGCWDNEDGMKEAKEILLKIGALDYRVNIDYPHKKKEQISTLLVKLTLQQGGELHKSFFDKVFNAQNMVELEKIVNDAIKSGVRLNYSFSQDFFSGSEYTFTDYVMKKISELEKNPKAASSIICQLVSKGAVFGNAVDANMINTLTSEFKEHKTNVKKAYRDYVSNSHKFIEIAKSATDSELKDARIDNSVFYLEYSEDSKIDIAKITDGTRGLGLTDGDVKCGRNIVKIGKSEVEIQTEGGIRYYTDLAEGSDIVLTFSTSLGELEVNLYPDKQDKDKIIVEVSNKKEILERFKNCKEELGKNCLLGGCRVYDAIEQGYFKRSGKLMRSEVMSQSNGQTKKSSWVEREEIRRAPSLEETVSRA